ncbi:hypothetical protein [Mammaliicoccus vitulinus]|uniref:hypothetical protein n=1 Tax=Mammaliicoccus vitulinus TaxID=71237 RepID=UPI0039B0505C
MSSVLEQIQEIQTKDELIKWLVNEYERLSDKAYKYQNSLNKVYGNILEEERQKEIKVLKDKVDKLIGIS